MLRHLNTILFGLYCFTWFRIPLSEDNGIPFQRVLGWGIAIALLGNFFISRRVHLGKLSKTILILSFLFLSYLAGSIFIHAFFYPNFSLLYFVMDYSKYIAIFACFFGSYYVLKRNYIHETKFEKLIILSGILCICLSYVFLFLYQAGFRSNNEVIAPSFGGGLGVWPTSISWLPRLAGPTAEPQQFSIIFLTPLLLMLQKKYQNKYHKTIFLGILALFLSQSKFAFISLVFLFIYFYKTRKKNRPIYIFLLISLLPLFLVAFSKLPTFIETLSSGFESQAFVERYENLILLIDIIKRYFLFGIGAGNYGIFRGEVIYGNPNFESSYKPNLDYLKIFAETGFIGFMLMILVLGFMLKSFIKAYHRVPPHESEKYLAFLLGIIAIYLNMFIGYELLHIFFWINAGYLMYVAEKYLYISETLTQSRFPISWNQQRMKPSESA